MQPDPYAVLGVSSRASLGEAEDAYHRLLRQEHPDLHHTAGPERVAHAERRTRELNAAISAIRDAATVTATTGRTSDDPAQGRWVDGSGSGDRSAGRDAAPSAPCPWCGERFERAVELKDHVLTTHDLRLDRRVRGGLFGGRIHRWVQAAGRLPLWAVLPVNTLVAAVVAALVTVPTNESLGWWAFAVVMAPSAVTVLDRAFDATR